MQTSAACTEEPLSSSTGVDEVKLGLLMEESEKAFNSEALRMDRLTSKAERYIAAIGTVTGIYIAAMGPEEVTVGWQRVAHSVTVLLALVFLGVALITVILSMCVRSYRSYPRGRVSSDQICAPDVTEDAARYMIAEMYLGAYDINARINDQRSRLLAWSGLLLIAGFTVAVLSRLFFAF